MKLKVFLSRPGRLATLIVLALVLGISPVLLGCGGGGGEGANTVVIGWLTDQTGPSGGTFKEVQWGLDDYMADMDPIPGIDIKYIAYDTRLDYARVPQGYQWLKTQGVSLILEYSPALAEIVSPDAAEDQIPNLGFSMQASILKADMQYAYSMDLSNEGKFLMSYLVKDWWETKTMTRPIKVGVLFPSGMVSPADYWGAFQAVSAANPGKVELRRQEGPNSQTAWASEAMAMIDCDAIIMASPGPATPTFMKEARQRGFKGQFVGTTISILGAWSMVSALLTPADLDGIVIPHAWHVWTEDNAFVSSMKTALEAHRASDAAKLKQGTTWLSGYTFGRIITEIVRSAASSVGPENVDSAALTDAITNLNLEIEGLPSLTLANSGGAHVIQPCLKMIRYDGTKNEWNPITDWQNVFQMP